ncbi:MAG: lytic transglycosylase domain-containing protein [Desulfobacterota bacterium]|nr:lytic transglycosylase domain-containing protein [Thermodesulfobacteriota bacterium]
MVTFKRLIFVLVVVEVVLAPTLHAYQITVPLRFDLALIRQQLFTHLYTEPGGRALVMDDGRDCQNIFLRDPEVSAASGKLRILTLMEAQTGVFLNEQCISGKPVQGYIEILQEVLFDNATRELVLHTSDANLYDATRTKNLSQSPLWNLAKEPLYRRIGDIRIPLQPLIDDVRLILLNTLDWPQEEIGRMLDSLRFGKPVVDTTSLTLEVSYMVPDQRRYEANVPEPMLSPEEIQSFQHRLNQLDAFLTFIIKQFARSGDPSLQQQLTTILLDARYELIESLGTPVTPKEDPVTLLFLRTWDRLAPIVREISRRMPSQNSLSYLSFITAVDALAAIRAAGPGLGIEITSDGLRRLARMLDAGAGDPLIYSMEVDPELRKIFGFGPPLPPPDILPDRDIPEPQAPRPSSAEQRAQRLRCLISQTSEIFRAPHAFAADPQSELKRLNGWAPTPADLPEYLPLVERLLFAAAAEMLATSGLDKMFHQVYRNSILATAWQESCWRQFIKNGDKVTALTSAAGSVGIMQINAKVWRGLYDVKGIYGDILYNARAGCEILMHYIKDYAVQKGEHNYAGGIDNLARAAYAAYNGGPAQLSRYRCETTRQTLKDIDALFWQKYAAVKAGRVNEVASCYR